MITQWLLAAQSTAKHLSPFSEEKTIEHVQVEEFSFG